MSLNAGVFSIEKNHSYQHLQGTMLGNLNKLASRVKLSHSDYRVMGTLIGLYNKQHGMAFPTMDQLANYCCMGKSTIIKSLNNLVKLNLLVVVKTPGKRNNYYFSKLILNSVSTPHAKLTGSTSCKTAHDMKQIKIETDKKQTLSTITNDNDFKPQSITEYRDILTKLESWEVIDAKKLIQCHGINKIKNLIEIIKQKTPNNPGAYLRSLIRLPGYIVYPDQKTPQKRSNITDGLKHCQEVAKINEPRLSREEIIKQLEHEGKIEEVLQLKKLWKLI